MWTSRRCSRRPVQTSAMSSSTTNRAFKEKNMFITRYRDRTRMNHWAVALLFICAGLTGLALFHPAMYFFSAFFGGGQWTRILHPFFGLFMVLGFVFLFCAVVRDNYGTKSDTEWVKKAPHMVKTGDEHHMPAVHKYNAG